MLLIEFTFVELGFLQGMKLLNVLYILPLDVDLIKNLVYIHENYANF